MTITEKILDHVKGLPEPLQAEVLDYVEYLEARVKRDHIADDEKVWADLSLSSAMRGMEDEPSLYTLEDIKRESAA